MAYLGSELTIAFIFIAFVSAFVHFCESYSDDFRKKFSWWYILIFYVGIQIITAIAKSITKVANTTSIILFVVFIIGTLIMWYVDYKKQTTIR